MSNDKKSDNIPNSSTKHARGSKSVHSEYDDSTEDGFQPKEEEKEKSKTKN